MYLGGGVQDVDGAHPPSDAAVVLDDAEVDHDVELGQEIAGQAYRMARQHRGDLLGRVRMDGCSHRIDLAEYLEEPSGCAAPEVGRRVVAQLGHHQVGVGRSGLFEEREILFHATRVDPRVSGRSEVQEGHQHGGLACQLGARGHDYRSPLLHQQPQDGGH